MVTKSYSADSIEVLEGLDPVKKRPGMYTDTSRPNHLAQEVIDNSEHLKICVDVTTSVQGAPANIRV